MNVSLLLGILGVIVSVIFGLWGIYLALRKAKYPASLTFVRDQALGLFDEVTGKIPNLKISYRESEIDHSLIFVNGFIVNDGSKDISPEMVEKNLLANVPKNYEWLECVITSKSNDLIVSSKVKDSQNLEFELGLFRRNEVFSFQAIALAKDKKSIVDIEKFESKINWKHRIENLGKVKKIQIPSLPKNNWKLWVNRIVGLTGSFLYILTGVLLLAGGDVFKLNTEIHHMVNNNGKYEEAIIKPKSNDEAVIKFIDSDKEIIVRLNEYSSENIIMPIISKKNGILHELFILELFILELFLIGGGLFLLYLAFEKDYRKRKISKLIQPSAEKIV